MDSSQERSSSQQVQATTAGKQTSAAKSKKFSRRRRSTLTLAQEREIVQLYTTKTAHYQDIAAVYNIHFSTLFHILKRRGFKTHKERGEYVTYKDTGYETTPPQDYVPVKEQKPTLESAPPVMPPDVPVPKPRKPRKRKTLWGRIKAFFKR